MERYQTHQFDLRLQDNMKLMKEFPDNQFDWAIVDPPYGIKEASGREESRNMSKGRAQTKVKYTVKNWDNSIPSSDYFSELRRVSKNQIIWGWNYFVCYLSECPSYIVWDKDNSGDFSDCESAWCSKKGGARMFKWRWNGMLQQDMKNKEVRIHPTQKPIALYKWLLKNYANPKDKILDTHLGSMSIAIAVHQMNTVEKMHLHLTGCELDPDYYKEAIQRVKENTAQMTIFQ